MAINDPLGSFAGDLAPFLNAAFQQQLASIQLDMVQAFINAANGATREVSKQLTEMAALFEKGIARADLIGIHRDVGKQAQSSVVRSYGQTVKRNGGPSGYRSSEGKWQRYAGGRLGAALAAPGFYEATQEGLSFINIDLLNRTAAQWARLNFGAGSRGKSSAQLEFPIHFGTLVVAAIGLNEAARPAFSMPRGYFFDGQNSIAPNSGRLGQDAFYVMGTGPRAAARRAFTSAEASTGVIISPRKTTRGIKARNFLDAGVFTIADQIPRRYKSLMDQLAQEGVSTVRPASITVGATRRTY